MKSPVSLSPMTENSPFTPAVVAGNTIYVSGQLPVDSTGCIPATVSEQTSVCMQNLKALVEKAGFQMEDIVKTTVYMTDFAHFSEMNAAYCSFFSGVKPARCACQVSALARGAAVEIDCIAVKGE